MEQKRLLDAEDGLLDDDEDLDTTRRPDEVIDRVLVQPVAANTTTGFDSFVVYPRRWVVLILYALYCAFNAAQWIQYAIIADVIVKYYGVSYSFVNWTSVVYMVAYVVTIIPATWFYNKVGLRISILLAMGGTCLGAWIKVFSIAPDRFLVGFVGQTIVAVCQTYVLSIPVPLAATWFGSDQVSTACAIGVIGVQLGNAIGFFIPTLLVPHGTTAEIEAGLTVMFYGVATACTVLFVFQLIFLQSRPPTPPSLAQSQRLMSGELEEETMCDYLRGLWNLLKELNFVLIFLGFSISIAVFSAISTFLNQQILAHFKTAQDDAGYIGATLIVSGMGGTIVVGYILDQTRKYKETLLVVYAGSALAMVAFTLVLPTDIFYVYITTAVLGFFILGYVPAAFELAAEVTYPASEATSAGVMSLGCQILSVLYTLGYGWIYEPYGDFTSNLVMSGSLILGTILTAFVKSDLRRQQAGHQGHQA